MLHVRRYSKTLIKNMPPGSFWVLKISFIKKMWDIYKMKQCERNAISKWGFFLENLRSRSFILNLCYEHHRNIIVETIDIKCGLFQNTCLKERSNMVVAPSLLVAIYLYKKYCLQLSHGIKQIHRSKLYQW